MAHLNGLFKAIRYYGSQKALAKAIGRSRQNITNWINREEKIADLQSALQLFCQFQGTISLDELVENSHEFRELLKKVSLFDRYPTIEIAINQIEIPFQYYFDMKHYLTPKKQKNCRSG